MAGSRCYTKVNDVKFQCTWTIENVTLCQAKTGEFVKSTTFSADSDDKLWCLKVYPKGTSDDYKDYLSVYVCLVWCQEDKIRARFKFSILNARQEETNSRENRSGRSFVLGGSGRGYHDFVHHDFLFDEANGLLTDDNLTIFCEVSVTVNTICPSIECRPPIRVSECGLSDDFEALLDRQQLCDVTISVLGGELHAHKAVLAARSAVFSAMFEHDTEERRQSRVEIADLTAEVMDELLRFMYTGRSPNLHSMAAELLAAADKYAVERLKSLCEQQLYLSLSVDNVSEILILADIHSAEQLKSRAVDFVNSHAAKVVKTPGWKSMIQSHPQLVADAFHAVVSQQNLPPEPPTKRARTA